MSDKGDYDNYKLETGAGGALPAAIEWRVIDENYEVSSMGDVRSLLRKRRLLSARATGNDYIRVATYVNGVRRATFAHVLVARAFLGEPPGPGHVVDHINGIKHDNRVANLRWTTQRRNILASAATGTHGRPTNQARRDLIRARVAEGRTHRQIAEELGISPPAVTKTIRFMETGTWSNWNQRKLTLGSARDRDLLIAGLKAIESSSAPQDLIAISRLVERLQDIDVASWPSSRGVRVLPVARSKPSSNS